MPPGPGYSGVTTPLPNPSITGTPIFPDPIATTQRKIFNRIGAEYPDAGSIGALLGLPSADQEEGLYRPPPLLPFTGDMNLGGGDPMWPVTPPSGNFWT